MTNGEAARKLFDILQDDCFCWTQESVDAFNLAISALIKESVDKSTQLTNNSSELANKPIELTNDCISRQAAVKSMHETIMYRLGASGCKKMLDKWINSLPSFTPKQVAGKLEYCEDAVSRQAAVEEIRRHGVGSFDFEDYTPEQAERFVIKLLQDLPSVTPELCEDAVSRKDVIDLYKRGAEKTAKAMGISVEDLPHNGLDVLMNLPSVTPKRKVGKWERHNTYHGDNTSGFVDPDWRCSECGKNALVNEWMMYDLTEFCPNCGADMRGGVQE